jgi:periplasmic divalent cation tolerance protein
MVLILTTTSSKNEADLIASKLVAQKLAACVQINGPIESVYEWDGKLEKSQEWQLFIKTKKTLFQDIEKEIKALHSYDVPEIVSIDIENASKEYGDWVKSVCA